MKESNEKQQSSERKELTPQQIQKRKKMLIFPLFFLLFAGSIWFIFAPSGNKEELQTDGFNAELPLPKDEAIVGDKRKAYEQEAMQKKQQEKMRNLQDFAFALGEEEDNKAQVGYSHQAEIAMQENQNSKQNYRSSTTIQSSAYAYQDVNRQLNSWYDEPTTEVDDQSQKRIEELERKLAEVEQTKSAADEQLELIEKSYQIAAKYMPTAQNTQSEQPQTNESNKEKVVARPVSQVHHNVVSLLAAPMDNDEFLEQYSKPRNMGFITAAGQEAIKEKNAIRACVYKTVTISDGKELQLRLLEPMRAGNILIPVNTVLTGNAKVSGERLQITISSIQYADNIIPVEIAVFDTDGVQGIFVPNSEEINAVKEIAANMGSSMGSSITITDDAGSQLVSDLGRSAIQGASQYISKKMQTVRVTLKANYRVLLLPKA